MSHEDNSIEILWRAGMEMLVHQALYVRRLYPQESFCSSVFLDIKCKVNRHPAVVEYISQAVEMAVSAIFAGESREVSIVFLDQEKATELETYRICFDELKKVDESRIPLLERDWRDLILSMQGLEGLKSQRWPEEATFKIMILLSSEIKKTTALKDALLEGAWYSPVDAESAEAGVRRPIHQTRSFGCRLYSEVFDRP